MKCRYSLPHQPQKCGLLKGPWNDPKAALERFARAKKEESNDVFSKIRRLIMVMEQAERDTKRICVDDDVIDVAVKFWEDSDVLVCDHYGNEWWHGEKIKEGDHE